MNPEEIQPNPVEAFYNNAVLEEWQRMDRCPMEYAVTSRLLREHLPSAPAAIADIGGGPGRYAIDLCKMDYQVSLIDLSPKNISFATQKADTLGLSFDQCRVGNACEALPFPDASQDAVLLMGPLYHLTELEQRKLAVAQAYRILKPGGIIFAAFISLIAVLQVILIETPENLDGEWKTLQHGVNDPQYGFTEAYMIRAEEIIPLMEPFQTIEIVGVEGISSNFQEKYIGMESDLFERWVDLNLMAGRSKNAFEASNHILYIGKK